MMKNLLILPLYFLFILSGCKDEPVAGSKKISGFTIFNEHGEIAAEYNYSYDSEGRLNYKSNPLTIEHIQYINQQISKWINENNTGGKTETYHYNQERLDSVSINYVYPLQGLDLIIFSYENDKCTGMAEILHNQIINVYNFFYEDEHVSHIIVEQKTQHDTLDYTYEYDGSGNVDSIFLNGIIHSEFEYTTYENPLFNVSKSYLINIPVHPDQEEKETITSKYLISKATYYDWEGVPEEEISIQFTMNINGQPESAIRNRNGIREEILFEYQ